MPRLPARHRPPTPPAALCAVAVAATAAWSGCALDSADFEDMNAGYFEGHAYDEGRTDAPAGFDKADRARPYEVPADLPTLVRPEIILSLEGLTVHLFDRATGFSRVYPTGVGELGGDGRSITPTGHYSTHDDTTNGWYYVPARWEPAYFEGYPFLRINAENSRGYHTYGLHGPITNPLRRGYVSHGCARMAKDDLVELFTLVRSHGSTPVTIQQELERDAAGVIVDLGSDVTLWGVGDEIEYGPSVGPRDDSPVGFTGDACDDAPDCGDFAGAENFFCHAAGFCSQGCEGYCADRSGYASTYCVEDPELPGTGICVPQSSADNGECATVPGSVPLERPRYIGTSSAPPGSAVVCVPG